MRKLKICRKCENPLSDENWPIALQKQRSHICGKCYSLYHNRTEKERAKKMPVRVFTNSPPEVREKLENHFGRPPLLEPDDATIAIVSSMARIHCPNTEIAAGLGVSIQAFQRFIEEFPHIKDIISKAKENGKASLRAKTWGMANEGNWNALKHLNQHILGEHDKTSQDVNVNVRRNFLEMDTIEGEVIKDQILTNTRKLEAPEDDDE